MKKKRNDNLISTNAKKYPDTIKKSNCHIMDFMKNVYKNNKEIPMVMIVRLKKVKRDSLK